MTHGDPPHKQREGVSRTHRQRGPSNIHNIRGLVKEGLKGAQEVGWYLVHIGVCRELSAREAERKARREAATGKGDQSTPALPRAPPPPPAPGPSSLPSPSAPPGRRTCSRPAAPAAAPAAPAPPRPAPLPPSCAAGHAGQGRRAATTALPIGGQRHGGSERRATAIGQKGRPANQQPRETSPSAVRGGRKSSRVTEGACAVAPARPQPCGGPGSRAPSHASGTGPRGEGGAGPRGGRGGGAAPVPPPARGGPGHGRSRGWFGRKRA